MTEKEIMEAKQETAIKIIEIIEKDPNHPRHVYSPIIEKIKATFNLKKCPFKIGDTRWFALTDGTVWECRVEKTRSMTWVGDCSMEIVYGDNKKCNVEMETMLDYRKTPEDAIAHTKNIIDFFGMKNPTEWKIIPLKTK